jgi:hypothetical protein
MRLGVGLGANDQILSTKSRKSKLGGDHDVDESEEIRGRTKRTHCFLQSRYALIQCQQ